ncbi:DUF1501 domain-containing protein [Singulisphaera acidiphila]|uniref:DUF1501 domain-containing protein n=1 Tax=Singulisphaera acidiphila (strain ATCC BAA-1392 / DSM 18658 / VKM B-2454 / MOB10) TaxID=886293 RepID=L0DM02_SINAD|nr:DUF1501 domain-containing protein [Singulisphaera acidiphila]AGA30399.1 hypothetical protein Sinac_6317 [Singulisphaera acidiphila DSM 18658]
MSHSANQGPCRGPSRRDILRAGLFGVSGLALGDLLRLRTLSYGATAKGTERASNCILIWLAGGASHLDTFDPKPDAPADVRGEFKPIDTAVPGLKISEVFPTLATMMDRVSLIRSVTSPEADHDRAAHHLLTGYRPSTSVVYPSYGSVVAKAREGNQGVLPPYVAVPDAPLFSSSGYLTPAYDPFAVTGDPNQPSFRVSNLTPPDRVTLDRLRRRRSMVKTLDAFAHEVSPTPLTASRDQFADQAYDLLTSSAAQAAFRLDAEPEYVRSRYGRTPLGQSCLLARRLVEAGVSFVTLNDRGMGPLGWDTHQQNFPTIKNTLAPPLDKGVSALLLDLEERGLLDRTLVVLMGEFGRTPKINANAGRDHHGRANCALLAGAGLPHGLVLGKTDAGGDAPADQPVTPADLAATIYTALGIDPNLQFETPDGRPIRLVDGGNAPRELL